MPALIGNDVVDLNDPQNAFVPMTSLDPFEFSALDHKRKRFLDRVFNDEEQQLIKCARHPHLTLWSLWAAKEAAFKVMKKLDATSIFAHRLFVVKPYHDFTRPQSDHESSVPGSIDDTKGKIMGEVEVAGYILSAQWQIESDTTHCIVIHKTPAISAPTYYFECEKMDSVFNSSITLTPHEMESVYSPQSKAVRLQLKSMLNKYIVGEKYQDLEIIRDRQHAFLNYPYLQHAGLEGSCCDRISEIDISMSHDNKWIASALLIIASDAE